MEIVLRANQVINQKHTKPEPHAFTNTYGKACFAQRLKCNSQTIKYVSQREHQRASKHILLVGWCNRPATNRWPIRLSNISFPKLINQVTTTLLPVMIRLPNESCGLRDWWNEWLGRVRSGIDWGCDCSVPVGFGLWSCPYFIKLENCNHVISPEASRPITASC